MLIGANHRVAPLAIRERLAISRANLPLALRELSCLPQVEEAFLLSTCNRTEAYVQGGEETLEGLRRFWAERSGLPWARLRPYFYEKRDKEAVYHLFCVGAGIDSLVLGESQILGQIRDAFAAAQVAGTIGNRLDTILRKTLEASRRARQQTGLGSRVSSVSHAAVELMARHHPCPSLALILGAGEMAKVTAQALRGWGIGELRFCNRTLPRARELARLFKGRAASLRELGSCLVEVDLVVSCTDAPTPIIRRGLVEEAMARRDGKPLIIMDLAVPRDVEPGVEDLEGVCLYSLDDLEGIVATAYKDQAPQLQRAREILHTEAERVWASLCSRQASPIIVALRQRAEAIRLGELRKLEGKLNHLSPQERETIDALTRSIVNKLLHYPTKGLKEAASQELGEEYLKAAAELFGLEQQ
jgi:glutamyl-tRNA reductase